jgi:hypothetical protein
MQLHSGHKKRSAPIPYRHAVQQTEKSGAKFKILKCLKQTLSPFAQQILQIAENGRKSQHNLSTLPKKSSERTIFAGVSKLAKVFSF